MPVIGEIATFAFGGDQNSATIKSLRQQGWMACEGQSVARVTGPNGLPHLFAVVGTSWGSDDQNAFNVPDLRGEFLRGWNHGRGSDPDAASRSISDKGGIGGDAVGSAQPDAFANHNHGIKGGSPFGMLDTQEDIAVQHPAARNDRGNSHMFQGGNETRPRNIYVMYCIFTGEVPLPAQVKFFAT